MRQIGPKLEGKPGIPCTARVIGAFCLTEKPTRDQKWVKRNAAILLVSAACACRRQVNLSAMYANNIKQTSLSGAIDNEPEIRMSRSIAALFQRLTQGVYVVDL